MFFSSHLHYFYSLSLLQYRAALVTLLICKREFTRNCFVVINIMIHVESMEWVPRDLLMFLIMTFLGKMFLYVLTLNTMGQMFVFDDDENDVGYKSVSFVGLVFGRNVICFNKCWNDDWIMVCKKKKSNAGGVLFVKWLFLNLSYS